MNVMSIKTRVHLPAAQIPRTLRCPNRSKAHGISRARVRGVGLIEVLIAVLVTSIGLLGLASLQFNSLKQNQSAAMMAQANVLAYDMMDRLRANADLAKAGSYDLALTATTPTGTAIQDVDRAQWRDMLGSSLPGGTGSVACASTGSCTVTVQWNDQDSINSSKQDQIQLVSTL